MNFKIYIDRIIIVVFFAFFLLQQVLLEYTSGGLKKIIGYTDEVTECIFIALILLVMLRNKIKLLKIEWFMIIAYSGFVFLGLLSNIVNPMQTVFLNLSDMLICSRFIVFYFAVRILFHNRDDYNFLILDLAAFCRVFSVIIFVLSLHDIFFSPFFIKYDFRYFMYSLKLFFPHPTYMSIACVTCAVIIMAAMGVEKNTKANNFNLLSIFMLCASMCFTLRSKAIASAMCIVLLYLFIILLNVKSKFLMIGSGFVFSVLIGWEQFTYYFSRNIDTYARARMQMDSINIANENFPFGSGFATFGSAIAADHYSPLYTELGYSTLYGGNKDDTRFLCDSFWPTVLAQTGWIGFIAFAIVVILFIVLVFRAQSKNKYIFWSMLSIIIYFLISSVAETAFFNPAASIVFAFLGLLINYLESDSVSASEV